MVLTQTFYVFFLPMKSRDDAFGFGKNLDNFAWFREIQPKKTATNYNWNEMKRPLGGYNEFYTLALNNVRRA